jgi:histidinol-phosphate aminotransferase
MFHSQEIQPRKVLQKIKSYTPGKPIWEVQQELRIERVIKLASNENPLGPSPKAIEAITESLWGINRYPDAQATELRNAISSLHHLSTKQVMIGNGADELITLISETFLEAGDEIIVSTPSFSEYDFGAHLMGAGVVSVPLGKNYHYNLQAILSAVTQSTKIVYICSPNNPTGTYLPKGQLEQLLHSIPKRVLVVFDGAYSHYANADDYTDGLEYVSLGYPIVVLQTFSKIYGLAGVRIGFVVATESIIQNILKVKEPFNVNALGQVAATAALADETHVQKSQEVNIRGRQQLYEAFSKFGIPFIESMSNFVLVDFGANAKFVYEQLLAKGVIVRYGDTWGLPKHIRISIGTSEENEILIQALINILKR